MKLLLVLFAVAFFSALTIGGLAALRALRTKLVLRAILFLALCYAAFLGSMRLALQWDLNAVELGYAWAVALLVIAGVEWLTYWRRKRIIT
jgi:hypothetical protein